MKKIIPVIFIIIFLLPVQAFGHTTLTASTPVEGEILGEVPSEIQLEFGTVIEDASTMTLEGESSSYEFDEITVSEQTMTGSLSGDLPNGAYVVRWNIIGEDGHPIEGEIPFAIDAEEAEPAEEPIAGEETAQEEPAAEEPAEEAAEETSAEEAGGGSTFVTILLIVAGLLLVFGLYKLLSKKQ